MAMVVALQHDDIPLILKEARVVLSSVTEFVWSTAKFYIHVRTQHHETEYLARDVAMYLLLPSFQPPFSCHRKK